ISLRNHIDIRNESNYELALKIKTSILNDNFWTDLNGFKASKAHKRRCRNKYPISGNFYPITNFIFIEDNFYRVTLISNMGHAASSLNLGEIEVMLDRRVDQDDWRGLNEGVTDN
ncbi:hypothetical protein HELRODRAFT_143339, partial [Helobdella robusta]|uniref:Glycosyl hydrolase family 38 C-terminal domain-containing protein n=1 Tax=Helobdella robusta TaxID=6412 RepID=T1EJ99_HELRO